MTSCRFSLRRVARCFDLSGAYRVQQDNFTHNTTDLNTNIPPYWRRPCTAWRNQQHDNIRTAQLIAVPGCYPTVSQLALETAAG